LVIKGPGLAHRTDDRVVEQTDFLPTLLKLVGVEAPAGLPGRDMFAPDTPRPYYLERDRPPQWRQRAIVSGTHKLIVVENADISLVPESSRSEEIEVTNVHPGIYLYDLARDPGEKTNLFARDDSTSLSLLGMLSTHFATAHARPQPVQLDKDLLDKLRSLGYVR
jgi:arylsulfatase A-like enzyme